MIDFVSFEFPLSLERQLIRKGKMILTCDYDDERIFKKALKRLKMFAKKYRVRFLVRRTKRGFHVMAVKNGKPFYDDIWKVMEMRLYLLDDKFRLWLDYWRLLNGSWKAGILFNKKIYFI